MTSTKPLQFLTTRARRALRSAAGAFDLPSIIAAVVVVGILTAGVLAAIFGVIPFAQDNGAKQDLSAARTAEGVAKAKDGKYLTSDGLKAAGYLSGSTTLAVGTDTAGSCWVGFAKSGSGTVFYATAAKTDPQAYIAGTDTGCLTTSEQEALVEAIGATPAAPPTVVAAGYAASWGQNSYGQLGNGSLFDSPVPGDVFATGVLSGKKITAVSAGYDHSCAIADGAAYCWGKNRYGQLGNGTTTDSSVPVEVTATGVLTGKKITAVSAGGSHTCAVAGGAVYCWGDNYRGMLGNSTAVGSSVPVEVTATGVLAGETVTSVSAGVNHTCAVADGAAYCWGDNTNGQLGNNITTYSLAPVKVTPPAATAWKTVAAVSAGANYTCAVADGAAYCWGHNNNGQLGNGITTDSSAPVQVAATGVLSGKTVAAVSAGANYTCAVASGAAYCWGYSPYGGLGNSVITTSKVPVEVNTTGVLTGKTVTAISTRSDHTCAIANGAAYCWGYNSNGQLGDGTSSSSNVPVEVTTSGTLSGKKVTAVSVGSLATVAIYE